MQIGKLEKYSDWLNALLVREVRQSLRSKVFATAIILTSLLCVVTIICGILYQYTNSHYSNAMKTGMVVFTIIFIFIWIISCLILPVSAANRFRSEKSTGEFELFSITGISANKIILGKLQSSLVQAFIILSVAAPFMMVCYMLRGISAVDIFTYIVMLIMFTVTLTQIGIMVGCLKLSKAFFSIVNIIFVIGIIWSSSGFLVMTLERNFSRTFGGNLFETLVVMVSHVLYVLFLTFLCSVSILELKNKNRTFALKLFMLLTAIISPITLALFKIDNEIQREMLYSFFLAPCVISSLLILMPLELAPTPVRRRWKNLKFRKIFKPLLYPGRGSSMIWFGTLMLILTFWELYQVDFRFNEEQGISLICMGICFWAYVGNGFRVLFPNIPTVLLSLLGCVVPSVISLFFAVAGEEEIAALLCPVTLVVAVDKMNIEKAGLICAIIFWCIMILWGFKNFIVQQVMEKREDESTKPEENNSEKL